MAKNQKGIPLRLLVAVLLDGIEYLPNTALLVDQVRAKSLVDGGQADASDAAVEYALTQGELIAHVVPVVEVDPVVDESAAADPVVDSPQG